MSDTSLVSFSKTLCNHYYLFYLGKQISWSRFSFIRINKNIFKICGPLIRILKFHCNKCRQNMSYICFTWKVIQNIKSITTKQKWTKVNDLRENQTIFSKFLPTVICSLRIQFENLWNHYSHKILKQVYYYS